MSYTVLESTWLRSLVKGLTWETSGLITVGAIAFLFTGDVRQSLLISTAYLPVRVVMYWVHERLWKRFGWGHYEVEHYGKLPRTSRHSDRVSERRAGGSSRPDRL